MVGLGVACVVIVAAVVALVLGSPVNSPKSVRPSVATAESHAPKGPQSKGGTDSHLSTSTSTSSSTGTQKASSPTTVVPVSSQSSPSGYVYADSIVAVFVQWRSAGSKISGSLQSTYILPTKPAIVETHNVSLTASQSGQKLTVALHYPIYGDVTLTGTFSNSVLVLSVPTTTGAETPPQAFTPASVSDYQEQVNKLVSTAAAMNAPSNAEQQVAAQVAQLNQQEVTGDISAVASISPN